MSSCCTISHNPVFANGLSLGHVLLGYCRGHLHFKTDINRPSKQYEITYGDPLTVNCQIACGDLVFVAPLLRKANSSLNVSAQRELGVGQLQFMGIQQRTWLIPKVTEEHHGKWYCTGGSMDTKDDLKEEFRIVVHSKCEI